MDLNWMSTPFPVTLPLSAYQGQTGPTPTAPAFFMIPGSSTIASAVEAQPPPPPEPCTPSPSSQPFSPPTVVPKPVGSIGSYSMGFQDLLNLNLQPQTQSWNPLDSCIQLERLHSAVPSRSSSLDSAQSFVNLSAPEVVRNSQTSPSPQSPHDASDNSTIRSLRGQLANVKYELRLAHNENDKLRRRIKTDVSDAKHLEKKRNDRLKESAEKERRDLKKTMEKMDTVQKEKYERLKESVRKNESCWKAEIEQLRFRVRKLQTEVSLHQVCFEPPKVEVEEMLENQSTLNEATTEKGWFSAIFGSNV